MNQKRTITVVVCAVIMYIGMGSKLRRNLKNQGLELLRLGKLGV